MSRPALTIVVALATACTHHKPGSSLHEAAGREVVIEAAGHEQIAYVDVTPLGTVLRAPDGQIIPLAGGERVVDVQRGRGALLGLGIGFLAGALGGAVAGLASGDDPPCEGYCLLTLSAGGKAVIGGVMFGSLGGLIGIVVGAGRGSRVVYSFGGEQQYHVTPSGPPGSVAGATVTF
jgi:hypothetical protein